MPRVPLHIFIKPIHQNTAVSSPIRLNNQVQKRSKESDLMKPSMKSSKQLTEDYFKPHATRVQENETYHVLEV